MIGRDRECQIRPKSRSVSRKHCLLHWEINRPDAGPRFRIFDLDSTAGTRVNGTRIPSRTWIEVVDGSELRCGKIAFDLTIDLAVKSISDVSDHVTKRATHSVAEDATVPNPEPQPKDTQSDSPAPPIETTPPPQVESAAERRSNPAVSLLQGEAWQEVDVASFLEAEDDAAREIRYDDIRSRSSAGTSVDDDLSADSGIFDGDEGFFEDDPADDATKRPSLNPQSAKGSAIPKTKSSPTKQAPAPQKRPVHAIRTREPRDWDRIKTLAALAMTVAVLSFGIYQAVQFWSGPEVNLVDGID